jgi:hypothetical protein
MATPMHRRSFLGAIAAATAAVVGVRRRSAAAGPGGLPLPGGLVVQPRSAWGADLAPRGPLEPEAEGDVRFLLVHHTAGANGYPPEDVPGTLRGIYDMHTGPEKGWPDVAYNFFVDRHGGVWEGRTGSLDAPVKPDATGGSQGFAQLACFIGDHSTEPPTPEAAASMVALLAWLGERYQVDTSPGATTTFTSRGSNRWPAGTSVTATTISGHRDMSQTACPGDAGYALVSTLPGLVTERRLQAAAANTTTTTTAPATTTTTTSAAATNPETAAANPADPDDSAPDLLTLVGGGLVATSVAALALGGALHLRDRRHRLQAAARSKH